MPKLTRPCSELRVSWFGRLFYYCMPAKKLKVKRNIELVFQHSLSVNEKKRLAMAFYSHVMTCFKEIFLMGLLNKNWLKKRVEFRGLEHLTAAAEQNKGVILLTGHFGNWEFAPVIGRLDKQFKGKIYFIRKLTSSLPSLWQKITRYNFHKSGLHIIEHRKALIKIRSALKANDAVVFIMDQRAPYGSSISINSTFLGKETAMYSSMAAIVEKFKTPVIPTYNYRLSNKKHVIEFLPSVEWQECSDKKEAIIKNTLNYNEVVENMLLRHPEQWLWSYNRWGL